MKINKTYSFILLLAIKSLLIAQTRTIGERYLVSGGWKIYYGRFIQNTRQELFKKIDSNKKVDIFKFEKESAFHQFFILDGDTVDYYDEKGRKQGAFISFCSYGGKYGFEDDGEYSRCKKCDFLETKHFYKNDTLVSMLQIGYKNRKPTDTLQYWNLEFEKNRRYLHLRFDDEGYIFKGYTDVQSFKKQGIGYKYDIKTRKLLEKANYKDNNYADSVFLYDENGKINAEAFYENNKNKIFHRFYRTTGVRYAEVMIENNKIVSKNCFDEKGKNIIPCDSSKTLFGTPKGQKLTIFQGGSVQYRQN